MQNHFSFNRFTRLFNKYTLEHYRAHLMSFVVLLGGLGLVFGIATYLSKHPIEADVQAIFYMLGFVGAGTVFTSMIFSDLGEKRTAIANLTLPASHFEKYVLGWLYSFVIFIILYNIAFYLVAIPIVNMDDWQGRPKELVNIFAPAEDNRIIGAYWIFILLHAISIWGAVYFQKMHFIKTGFTFFLAISALALLNYAFLEVLLNKDVHAAIPFGYLEIRETPEQYIKVSLPEENQQLITFVFIIVAVLMWVASYLRLKEKQV